MQIDKMSRKPLYEQIILGIKKDILNGVLTPDEKLPSVREMAQQLLINPNTISKAYKQLESEGIIMTIRGKGTFIIGYSDSIRDERKVTIIKKQLKELVLEATYQKVPQAEIMTWVKEAVEALGG